MQTPIMFYNVASSDLYRPNYFWFNQINLLYVHNFQLALFYKENCHQRCQKKGKREGGGTIHHGSTIIKLPKNHLFLAGLFS